MGEPGVREAVRTPFGGRNGAFLGLRPYGINSWGGVIVERFCN